MDHAKQDLLIFLFKGNRENTRNSETVKWNFLEIYRVLIPLIQAHRPLHPNSLGFLGSTKHNTNHHCIILSIFFFLMAESWTPY